MFKNFLKKYFIYIILVFIVLFFLILLYIWMNEKPKITLNGDSFIALNLYDEYKHFKFQYMGIATTGIKKYFADYK